jgi:hypothetical protein
MQKKLKFGINMFKCQFGCCEYYHTKYFSFGKRFGAKFIRIITETFWINKLKK